MRIACPACDASYDVPDRLIGAGRRLRCAQCGHDWFVEPAAPAAATGAESDAPPAMRGPARLPPGPAAVPEPPPRDLPLHPALRRPPQVIDPPLPQLGDASPSRHPNGLRLAWAASILAVLAFLAVLLLFRAEIAEAWPPAARLYMALGLGTGG